MSGVGMDCPDERVWSVWGSVSCRTLEVISGKSVRLEHADSASVDFWCRVFGVPADVFTGVLASLPPSRHRLVAAYDGARLVSTVQVYCMDIGVRGESARPWGCIANVATDPEYRSRGIASLLMRNANEVMRDEFRCECGLLFTGSHSFYESLGWANVHGRVLHASFTGASIADFGPVDLDITAMSKVYDRWGLTGPVQVIRDALAWEHRVGPRLAKKTIFLADQAYAVLDKWDQKVAILEMAGEGNAVAELVRNALSWYSKGEPVFVYSDMECPPELIGMLSNVEFETVISGMIKGVLAQPPNLENFRTAGEDHF